MLVYSAVGFSPLISQAARSWGVSRWGLRGQEASCDSNTSWDRERPRRRWRDKFEMVGFCQCKNVKEKTYPSVYSACRSPKYASHLFPITLPHVKHRIGMIMVTAANFFSLSEEERCGIWSVRIKLSYATMNWCSTSCSSWEENCFVVCISNFCSSRQRDSFNTTSQVLYVLLREFIVSLSSLVSVSRARKRNKHPNSQKNDTTCGHRLASYSSSATWTWLGLR